MRLLACDIFVTFYVTAITFVTFWGYCMSYDRSRKWLLTINNPVDYGMTHDNIKVLLSKIKNIGYWCMSDEIGENRTYHTHLFLYRDDALRFSQIKKLFPSAHIDYCRGTTQDNRDYIRKEGKYKGTIKEETNLKNTFEESGTCPEEKQGARNDLSELYDMIKSGLSDYEILEENPNYMKRLETIERTRATVRFYEFENKLRKDLQVVYRYGASGVGKTRSIYEQHGFDKVYRITDLKHPFDYYTGQDIVVFEEFYSSQWRLSEMLLLLDIYPCQLRSRYNNKWACYTKVYINSNIPLDKQYSEMQKDNKDGWLAFLRRIHCVQVFDENGHIVDYTNMDDYINREEWATYEPEQLELPWSSPHYYDH
jgi:hypothetical protein